MEATGTRGPTAREATINSITTTPAPLQVGTAGVQFTITGQNFGAGAPSFCSAIFNLNLTTDSDTTKSGTFDVSVGAIAGSCVVTVPGVGLGQYATGTINLVSGPPTISGNSGIWWFGGFIPDCDPTTPYACYFTSTQLTVTPGLGGSAPTAASPAVWVPGANDGKVNWHCNYQDSSCASIIVTALSATSPDCSDRSNQTQFTVGLGGVSSAPYYVTIDTPSGMEIARDTATGNLLRSDIPYTANSKVGYETLILYWIRSGCGIVMPPVRVNEFFTDNKHSTALFNGAINTWPLVPNNPPPETGFNGYWDVNDFHADNTFTDFLIRADSQPARLNPPPQSPPPDPNSPGGFMGTSNVWLVWQLQTFRVGSITQELGLMMQLGDLTQYLDHARVLPAPPQ